MIARCELCGSTDRVQKHHLGGQNHAPYSVMWLCFKHHKRVTNLIRQAGGMEVMKYTSDLDERARRARLHALVFLWFVDEIVRQPQSCLEKEIDSDSEKAKAMEASSQ